MALYGVGEYVIGLNVHDIYLVDDYGSMWLCNIDIQ